MSTGTRNVLGKASEDAVLDSGADCNAIGAMTGFVRIISISGGLRNRCGCLLRRVWRITASRESLDVDASSPAALSMPLAARLLLLVVAGGDSSAMAFTSKTLSFSLSARLPLSPLFVRGLRGGGSGASSIAQPGHPPEKVGFPRAERGLSRAAASTTFRD